MSIAAIPSVVSIAAAAANPASNQAPNPPAAQPAPPQTSTNAATDTVQLTEAQRVYQLYNQGQQVPQIATSLSLTVAAVNSYLNLSQTG